MAVKPKPLFGGACGCVPEAIAAPKRFSFWQEDNWSSLEKNHSEQNIELVNSTNIGGMAVQSLLLQSFLTRDKACVMRQIYKDETSRRKGNH